MLSGEYRRSPRIVELDARKAQAKSQNKGKAICEVTDEEELDKGQDILKQKRGRKKVKVKTVQDIVVNSVEYKSQKVQSVAYPFQMLSLQLNKFFYCLNDRSRPLKIFMPIFL